MSDHPIKGSCLCHRVSYEVRGHLNLFQYCHCSRCRKFTGSAFAANLFVSPEHFHWLQGEDCVQHFALKDTKHFATAFCKHCGSSLPWLPQSGKVVIVPAGTLDGDPEIKPSQNIFCGSQASWYQSPHQLPEHEALPPRKK